VSAEQAERIGLASRVVQDDALAAEAHALARRLADGPTFAYAATKTLLTSELDMSLPAAIELEASTQALLMRADDHAEFYRAFKEKRPPRWNRR